jgi:hypothetical protein
MKCPAQFTEPVQEYCSGEGMPARRVQSIKLEYSYYVITYMKK